ncbi:MAG: response regulator [Acidimicrobiia bacterium]
MTDRSLTVLLIDEDDDDRAIIEDLIARITTMDIGFDYVSTYEEGLDAVEQNRHDVYLIEYRLGRNSGLDFVREAIRRGCTRPLFILTRHGDHEIDVQASDLGAAGYLEKGNLDGALLERSIRFGLASRPSVSSHAKSVTRPGDLQLQIALARGATVRDAAKAASVAERTAHRRLTDPAFRAEVDRLREDLRLKIVEQVAAQLSGEQFSAQRSDLASDG